MSLALRAVGAAIAQIYSHFSASFISNLVASLLSIPLLVVILLIGYATRSFSLVPLGITLLIGVLPNPPAAGLQNIAYELARGEIITLGDQWSGLRLYWSTALKIWLVSLVVTVLILANLVFYAAALASRASPVHGIAGPMLILWILLLAFWLALHLYVYPLILVQEAPGIVTTYRNAMVMTSSRPLFTCITVPIWLAVLLFSAATGLSTIIGLALGAAIQQNAVARLIPTFTRPTSP